MKNTFCFIIRVVINLKIVYKMYDEISHISLRTVEYLFNKFYHFHRNIKIVDKYNNIF